MSWWAANFFPQRVGRSREYWVHDSTNIFFRLLILLRFYLRVGGILLFGSLIFALLFFLVCALEPSQEQLSKVHKCLRAGLAYASSMETHNFWATPFTLEPVNRSGVVNDAGWSTMSHGTDYQATVCTHS